MSGLPLPPRPPAPIEIGYSPSLPGPPVLETVLLESKTAPPAPPPPGAP